MARTKSSAISKHTRKVMQANKGSNTLPEIRIRSLLHKSGLRYSINRKPEIDLNRRADILFRKLKIAVFIHGCFWHGCPKHFKMPKSNTEFWKSKIARNRARDRETNIILRKRGWRVIEIWEHQSSEAGAKLITRAVLEKSMKSTT